jgi:hypothetical protein
MTDKIMWLISESRIAYLGTIEIEVERSKIILFKKSLSCGSLPQKLITLS